MSTSKCRAALYCRVSLVGQSLDNQLVPLKEFVNARGLQLVGEYCDDGISGTKERRPSLDRLMRDARLRKFDILVVSAIDRIGRSTKHLLNLLAELTHYGVKLISLREGFDFTTPIGEMVLTVLAAVASLERQIISERIKVALKAKKILAEKIGSDWRCGRPTKVTKELTSRIIALHNSGQSVRKIENLINRQVARSSISNIISDYKKSNIGN